ncbi:MAG: peptide chain release factor 2 [Clostridiales bacterium]|nr:peptide chain release factor 2 [Clostridiales bacterium]
MLEFEEYKVKLGGLKPKLQALGEALKLDEAKKELSELEAETEKDGFWDDLENSQKVMKQIKWQKAKCDGYKKLETDFDDLYTICEMALEENDDSLLDELKSGFTSFEEKLEEANLTTLLSGEYDSCGAMISLHAGAGGTEAQDWAQMLYRMYQRWAERHGFDFKVLDYLDGEEAGLKSATVAIDGENAYGYLKSENGIHRLVRISPFDSSGRRHTSFAAVEVMPQIEDEGAIEIRPDDLKVDTYRSSGAGGQHVNKTESAIRITHIPSGIVVSCQTERSQHQNRDYAMSMLRSRLAEIKERQHLERVEDIKGVQMKIEWGSQIRSYVFMPYTLAKDHRTNYENGNISAVMDGDIDGFINAYLSMNAGK